MKITINPLSLVSIEQAIKDITAYRTKLKRLEEELPKALAEFGAEYAKVGYSTTYHNLYWDPSSDGLKTDPANITVTAKPTDKGWQVLAEGEEVCFVEFGAGVFLNADGGGMFERPEGVVGIGEYGQGKGKNNVWAFGSGKNRKITYGTKAANVLYFTAKEIEDRIVETARRILTDD
jgi:hypothetical protein